MKNWTNSLQQLLRPNGARSLCSFLGCARHITCGRVGSALLFFSLVTCTTFWCRFGVDLLSCLPARLDCSVTPVPNPSGVDALFFDACFASCSECPATLWPGCSLGSDGCVTTDCALRDTDTVPGIQRLIRRWHDDVFASQRPGSRFHNLPSGKIDIALERAVWEKFGTCTPGT